MHPLGEVQATALQGLVGRGGGGPLAPDAGALGVRGRGLRRGRGLAPLPFVGDGRRVDPMRRGRREDSGDRRQTRLPFGGHGR